MAFDAFMKITDIPGESKDSEFKDWIEILAFDHGVEQPISKISSSSGGATAGRVNFDPVTITKLTDKATPKLWEADCTGKHIKEVIIVCCRAGGQKQKFQEIKMEQVIVSSFKQSGGGDFPSEIVKFVPGNISLTYFQQSRENGTPTGSVAAGWDLARNTPSN